MWDGKDRRQFYRVSDRVAMRYTRLRDEAAVSSEQARLSLHNRLSALDRELAHELAALAEQCPRTHHVATLINEKLAMVMAALGLKEYPDDTTLQPLEVNISASGLAFDVDEWVKAGERLRIDLLFFPEAEHFSAIVKVLSSDTIAGGYRLRTDFERLPENDQERLIRHILSVQSRTIRQLRYPPAT
ncbi:MAG: PilZ domain-containing protein [Marinobacter sp.]|uniref:PilZ domain-containing protein n=1 Tax=Marinobacter sp. TaxID=50741 RepID=UPI0034A02679